MTLPGVHGAGGARGGRDRRLQEVRARRAEIGERRERRGQLATAPSRAICGRASSMRTAPAPTPRPVPPSPPRVPPAGALTTYCTHCAHRTAPRCLGASYRWEFYAGGHGADAKWVTGDVQKAAPLVTWNNHTGVVTMTYFHPLQKYILTVSTATLYPSMTHQVLRCSRCSRCTRFTGFPFHTAFLTHCSHRRYTPCSPVRRVPPTSHRRLAPTAPASVRHVLPGV